LLSICPPGEKLLLRKSSAEKCVGRFGGIDLRAHARIANTRRADTPTSPQNGTSFTLRDLSGEFGLSTLPGKLAAVCPDAHVPRDRDVVNALEVIKTVTGESRVRVNPKGLPAYDAKLFCRFSIAMNQLPKMSDSSAAMRKRVLVARFPRGREQSEIDPALAQKLRGELPGITLWALRGLRQLVGRGRFVQPAASQSVLDTFTRWSSPVLGFIEDCCVVAPGERTLTSRVQRAWQFWCHDTGHVPGSDDNLGVQLLAANLNVEKKRLRCDDAKGGEDNRKYHYLNIALQPDALKRVIRAERDARRFEVR
jgi:putative DNA primase/helicase